MPEETAISLQACRNEWEAFQIVIRSESAISNINVTLSDLTGPESAILASSSARLYREHYINVVDESPGSVTYHERGTGLYPDPLIPFTDPYAEETIPIGAPFIINVAGDEGLATVFIDWFVPEDADPGIYSGTLQVTADYQTTVELQVSIEVWELNIPKERTIATAFGFGGNVRDYHGGLDAENTSEDYSEISRRYYQAMHDHRMDPTRTDTDVQYNFDENGDLLPVDWIAHDAALEPFLSGSLFDDGVPVTRFDVHRFRPGSGLGGLTEDQYKQAAAAYAQHLVDKGWWDKAYTYATDEPWLNGGDETWDQIEADIDRLNEASSLWERKTLITGPKVERVGDRVGIWCPVTPMYENWFYTGDSMAGREEYVDHLASGNELWFYVCNANLPPYAGYDIDTNIGYEPRIVKWGTYYEHASGFLYWRMNYWVNNDPWNTYLNLEEFGDLFARNGDGFLFYPGDHDGTAGVDKGSPEWLTLDGPVVSYRMKQIRDGLEDWELFRMAENEGLGEYTRNEISKAYTRFGDFSFELCPGPGTYCPDDQPWTLDENVLFQVRERIAKKLLYTLYPDRYDDPDKPVEDGDAELEAEAESEAVEDGDMDEETTAEIIAEEPVESDGDTSDSASDGDDTTPYPENKSNSGCNSGEAGSALAFAFAMFAIMLSRRKEPN